MTVRLNEKPQIEALLASVDTILFDCDGVLWTGDHILPNTAETLQLLTDLGKKLLFVSNNSSKTPEDYIKKLPIPVERDAIITSSIATALYVKNVLKLDPSTAVVHVVGGEGVSHALESVGYTTTRLGGVEAVCAVVVGLDVTFSYEKAATALQYLLNPKCTFIATNNDSTFPKDGTRHPGAGSIVAMMATAAGRTPDAICGKPNPSMMEAIAASHNLKDMHRCLMVGDRLDTDMAFGSQFGLQTLLVETGIDSVEGENPLVSFILPALGCLFTTMQATSSSTDSSL